LDRKKLTILCVSIGAVGLIIAAVVIISSLADGESSVFRDLNVPLVSAKQQYDPDPPQTMPPTEPGYYEPAPTAPPQTMPPQTAPPATAPPAPVQSSGGWAVEVWKEGNPPPIGVAFFTDYDKAMAWSKAPTKGWQQGSGPISYSGDKAAYLWQFGESDPSTYTPVEIFP
jgi:hypothetical protein